MTDQVRLPGEESRRRRHAVWGREIPHRNSEFIGREKELADLRDYLVTHSAALISQPVRALFGLGGVGKTELAAEYAHRFRTDYDLVWWIRAEREEAITGALVALGTRLGLEEFRQGDRDYSMGVVMDALIAGDPVDNWLLIFDDAQNAAVISKYIPQSQGKGHVIITSRDIRWRALRVDGIELTEFKPHETVEFLRKRVPALAPVAVDASQRTNEDGRAEDERRRLSAESLADALGNLPLAVEHAAAYLKETGVSADEYLKMYEQNAHELLAQDTDIPYPRAVATTWSVSTHALSPEAREVFQLLAFFAPEPIAEELLAQLTTAELPGSIAEILADTSMRRTAIRELARYSLVKIDGIRNIAQVHRVVRKVTRDRLEREDPDLFLRYRETVHLLLAGSDPRAPDREESWPIYERSREHIVPSDALECDVPAVRALIINQVRRLHRSGGYIESLSLGEAALTKWGERFGSDDKQTLTLAVEVGVAMRWAGRLEEACQLNSDTLEKLSRGARTDEVYLECARSYGRDLSMLGRYADALENDLQLVPLFAKALGPTHVKTLDLRNNIAISLRCLGRFDEALKYDQEVLDQRKRTLRLTDEDTLVSEFAVARDLRRLGRYEESLDCIRAVNETLEHKGGPWTLFRLLVGAELGLSLRRVGLYDEARRQGQMILDRHHALVGENHRRSLLTATYLINDVRFTGYLDDAAKLGEKTVQAWEKVAGPDHPNTNAARANLAVVWRMKGELTKARELDERALACFSDLYGEDHPSALVVRTNLASDLAAVGQVQQARAMGEAALVASRRIRGEHHPTTLALAANLSLDRRAVGDEAGAHELRVETLAGLEAALGRTHPQARLAVTEGRLNVDIEPMAT